MAYYGTATIEPRLVYICIPIRTGQDVLHRLTQLTDAPEADGKWANNIVYIFCFNGVESFVLKPNGKSVQRRNGVISFKTPRGWVPPSYNVNVFLSILDFSGKYIEFMQITRLVPDPTDISFQYFVLFQFEIAPRVGTEHPGIPTRVQTVEAIDIAIYRLNTHEAYKELLKMFIGNYWNNALLPERMLAYNKLKRLYHENLGPPRYDEPVDQLTKSVESWKPL